MPTASSTLVGLFETEVARLMPVAAGQRDAFLKLPLERRAHAEAHASVDAFRQVEVGGTAAGPAPNGPLRVAAWNLERCLYPELSAQVLKSHGVHLALLTEMDFGMLRTGQAHTIARVADAVGGRYAYGLEFVELLPMQPPAGFRTTGNANEAGFHGNGLVTAAPFENPAVIRLEEVADWFVSPKGGQRRVGNRMAVVATITRGPLHFVACSVHLESNTDGTSRAVQMSTLLDQLEVYAEDLPILIGGDLNTGVGPGHQDDPAEPLFAVARKRGYDFTACNVANPTTRTSIWSENEGDRQLDWFCARGLTASNPEVIPALGPAGQVLTDHELILVTVG